jgi:hypothetical protein
MLFRCSFIRRRLCTPTRKQLMGNRRTTQRQHGTNDRQSHRNTFHGTRPDQFFQPRDGKHIGKAVEHGSFLN